MLDSNAPRKGFAFLCQGRRVKTPFLDSKGDVHVYAPGDEACCLCRALRFGLPLVQSLLFLLLV